MSVFTPLSTDLYSIPRVQILFRKKGSTKYINLGDAEAFTITPDLTEIERYSKEYPTRTLARTDVTQRGGTIGLTLLHFTPTLRGAMFMADPTSTLVQTAVLAGSVEFDGVAVGDIYSLGAVDVAVSAVTDGESSPKAYTAGTHYRVDRRTGFVEILAKPDGAGSDITVSYTAPEITAAAARQSLGLMANTGVRGEIFARGVGDIGPLDEVTLWDVELRPSGDIEIQGGDDYQQIALTGRLYADGTKASGYQYGRIRAIPRTALS